MPLLIADVAQKSYHRSIGIADVVWKSMPKLVLVSYVGWKSRLAYKMVTQALRKSLGVSKMGALSCCW